MHIHIFLLYFRSCIYKTGSLELCLRVQNNVVPAFAQMWPCDDYVSNKSPQNSSSQVINYNKTTGQLMSGSRKCLTPYSFNEANNAASGLILENCVKNGPDEPREVHLKQRFHYSFAQRLGASGRVITGIQTTMCLALKSSAPLNSNVLQMWVKRLPAKHVNVHINGANTTSYTHKKSNKMTAVFLINSDKYQAHNVVFNTRIISNIFPNTHLPKYSVRIRDIWKHISRNKVFDEHASSWVVKVPPRDSKFYVLELVNEYEEQNHLLDHGYAPKNNATDTINDKNTSSEEGSNNLLPNIEHI